MGETDEYPSWAAPLLARRMLWKDYGISLGDDLEFEELLLAMRLHGLETERERWEAQNK